MVRFMADCLQEGQIPEIWETGEEKCLSDRDLKRVCFEFARKHFQGKSFRNRSIHQDIAVSRDGLGEWRTKTKTRDQALSVKILDALLMHGVHWRDGEDLGRDPNLEKYVYFKQPCRVNGANYTAILTIRVYKAGGYHKYYHHYLDDAAIGPKERGIQPPFE
jgi:hypothetical protein